MQPFRSLEAIERALHEQEDLFTEFLQLVASNDDVTLQFAAEVRARLDELVDELVPKRAPRTPRNALRI